MTCYISVDKLLAITSVVVLLYTIQMSKIPRELPLLAKYCIVVMGGTGNTSTACSPQ